LNFSHPIRKLNLNLQKTGERRQIGLFVGKFAPIHLAHLVIADQVWRELNLERILFMPEYDDENGTIISLLVRALQGHPGFGIDMARLNRARQPLIDTLKTLIANNPETDFYLIAGSDEIGRLSQLEMRQNWRNWCNLWGCSDQNLGPGRPYRFCGLMCHRWISRPKICGI
jgi:nicotinate-nucleotide adenylyltransferase